MLLLNNNQGKWNFNTDMLSLLINEFIHSFLGSYVIYYGKRMDEVQICHHITHCHVELISLK